MKTQWIQLKLLDDVVFSRDAASEGGHETLDFIPGSALLGALLGRLAGKELSIPDLLLKKQVQAGNGYPVINGELTFPVPLSFHRLKGTDRSAPIINGLDFDQPSATASQEDPADCVQMRKGYLAPENKLQHEPQKGYRMKTARDRSQYGTALESALFGFESLLAGQVFRAPVTAEPAVLDLCLPKEDKTLRLRLGRSRSAEYATVEISRCPAPTEPQSGESRNGEVVLYCKSDFCPALPDGQPTMDLTAALRPQLGDNAEFNPLKSFLRTRFYWPWNRFFGGPDRGRTVLYAGSVLVFNNARISDTSVLHLGLFQSEGLGKILINPSWVLNPPTLISNNDGKATDTPNPNGSKLPTQPETPLFTLIASRMEADREEEQALKLGKEWSTDWIKKVNTLRADNKPWPKRSQWSAIRSFAARARGNDCAALHTKLKKYFTEGLRRSVWDTSESGLGTDLLNKLTNQNDELAARRIRALYHASIAVYRSLSKSRNQ